MEIGLFARRMRVLARAAAAWFENNVVCVVPFWCVRKLFHRLMGARIGKGSQLNMRTYFMGPGRLSVGEFTHVNPGCIIDYRGGVEIGSGVSISHRVMIFSGGHDMQSRDFAESHAPVRIGDHVWIGAGATILKGVEIGEGAVVGAGAVVARSIPPHTIVGGVPARKIGERATGLDYKCHTTNIFM